MTDREVMEYDIVVVGAGPAETRRERHLLAKGVLHFLRQRCDHRRLEDARCDGHDADAVAG